LPLLDSFTSKITITDPAQTEACACFALTLNSRCEENYFLLIARSIVFSNVPVLSIYYFLADRAAVSAM